MSSKKVRGSAGEKTLSPEEQEAKINEIRKLIGPATSKVPVPCSDDIISRYLRARNWNTKKATKMLKDTIKWRMEHKPEKIRWEDIAQEAETGKIYRANYHDKQGRTVLVMRPGFQNTNSTKGQIKYLVYCIENALMNLNPDQEEMVWLIDFQGWTMSSISMKMVRPFLETKTYQKVKFVYSNDAVSQKKMEELFDMDTLESSFGGRNSTGFNYETYAKQMMEDDKKMANFINSGCSSLHFQPSFVASEASDGSGIASSHENPPVSCKDVPKIEADMPKEMQKGRVSGE